MKYTAVAVVFTLLAWTSVGKASVLDVSLADDGDGVITCVVDWDEAEDVAIDGVHNEFDAGHVVGTITTDTPEDPNLNIINSMENDTGQTWIGYHLNVSMSHTFTLSNALVLTPGDWTSVITSQPVWNGSVYLGQIDYTAGTPVLDTEYLDFKYRISFSGSTSYAYCQEMIPISVPEPGSLALVACGLLGLFVLQRRSA